MNRTRHKLKCEFCLSEFEHIDRTRRYCSLSCSAKDQTKNKPNRKKIEKICQYCGCVYNVCVSSKSISKFCGRRCYEKYRNKLDNRKAYVKKHRVIYKTKLKDRTIDEVSPNYILSRDNMKCHICGKKINIKYKYPHPLSASLDHIIPISKGGEHSTRNIKAAHFGCNSSKCNRSLNNGEQQLLFG